MSSVDKGSSRCTICQHPVGNSWYISEVGDIFCASHKNPSFCQGCRRPLPLGASGDMCVACIPTLVSQESQTSTIQMDVLKWLTEHIGPNGLHRVPVAFDEPSNFVVNQKGVTSWSFDGQNFDVGIRILRNVTPNTFQHTLAHEYGHVLLLVDPVSMAFRGGFPSQRHIEEEGFCEVVRYLWLQECGEQHREFDQRDLRNNPDPVYGDGFRLVWKEYEKLGSIVALRAHTLGISAKTLKKRKFDLPLTITLSALALFVFIPMLSAFEFSIRTPAKGGYGWDQYLWAIREEEFFYYIIRSGWLAALTVLITLLVLVPTMTWLHLSKSTIRPFVDGISLLPLVIPVVAFAVGAQITFPEFVQDTVLELPFLYFVLALPYAYRTLDIGLNSIPLKTLTEAARSAGANWWRTIITVIIPVIKSAVVGTVAITFALSLGEYTLTVLLHWDTFPTWVTFVAQENILGAIAISMMSLIIPFLVLTAVTLVSPERSTQGRK